MQQYFYYNLSKVESLIDDLGIDIPVKRTEILKNEDEELSRHDLEAGAGAFGATIRGQRGKDRTAREGTEVHTEIRCGSGSKIDLVVERLRRIGKIVDIHHGSDLARLQPEQLPIYVFGYSHFTAPPEFKGRLLEYAQEHESLSLIVDTQEHASLWSKIFLSAGIDCLDGLRDNKRSTRHLTPVSHAGHVIRGLDAGSTRMGIFGVAIQQANALQIRPMAMWH